MRLKHAPLALLLVTLNLSVWAVALPGCTVGSANPNRSALKAAEVSFMTYESVSNAVVSETKRLLEISYARPLTDGERETVSTLNDLRGLLDRYARAHNGYVYALKAGQGIEQARTQVVGMWRQVTALSVDLGLNFNAVAP